MPEGSRALAIEREHRAWELSVQGWSQREIAAQLEVSQAAVWKMLRKAARRYTTTFSERVAAHTARQFDRLEYIIAEAFGAWQASKAPRKRSRKKTLAAGAGTAALAREEDIKEATTSSGDTAHLRSALDAIAEENRLLGLHAPKKIDLRDTRRPLEQLSDEELVARINAGLTELAGMDGTT